MKPDFVTIVVPALNEEAYIARAVRSLALEGENYEILVLDGGSTDQTASAVEGLAKEGLPVRVVNNPRKIQSAALNIAAEIADPRSRFLVRADAHCLYPKEFARKIASSLARTGAASVVVPMTTVGNETCFQNANVAAQNSILGNGGSAHRTRETKSGWIEHGHHAGFDRKFFQSIGGYDEEFITNQDAEYDARVHHAGGQIWLDADCAIEYFPRKTPKALARQYYKHGRGRAMTVFKHRQRMKLRQIAPAVVFVICLVTVALSSVWPVALIVPGAYLLACLGIGFLVACKRRLSLCAYAMGFPAIVMHLCWGAGFTFKALRLAVRGVGEARKEAK